MVLLLLACTELAPEGDVALSDDTWRALAGGEEGRATRVETFGSVRFADGGAPVNDPEGFEGDGRALRTVVEADGGVRIVDNASGQRLLLWLDRDDLLPVVHTSVWVGANGNEAASGAPGLRLRAGTPVEMDAWRASVRSPWSREARAPVADGLLDEWFVEDDSAPEFDTSAALAPDTVLRDGDGAALTGSSRWWKSARLAAREGDEVLVEVDVSGPCEATFLARGWVPAEAVEPDGRAFGRGFCCGFGWGISGRAWGHGDPKVEVRLDVGTLLYDAPDGDVVGVTVADEAVYLDDDAGAMPGWLPVAIPTDWGAVPAWAHVDGPRFDGLPAPEVDDESE
jgi:hypothetical protein